MDQVFSINFFYFLEIYKKRLWEMHEVYTIIHSKGKMSENLAIRLAEVNIQPEVEQVTSLKPVARTWGGELAGPCPECGGRDRFRVWPNHPNGKGRFWCRVCGKSGDILDFRQWIYGESFAQALAALGLGGVAMAGQDPRRRNRQRAPVRPPEGLTPPGLRWQARAQEFVLACQRVLWSKPGAEALEYLRGRGLVDDVIRIAGLGYNPRDRRQSRKVWGLKETGRKVWLPRGWVIPWMIGGDLWRVNIRRPDGDLQRDRAKGIENSPKYIGPAGFKNALYNADALSAALPAMLVEGELDALILLQTVGDLAVSAATGSTGGARRPRWIARLAQLPLVLVSFDAELGKGDEAAAWWIRVLSNARRWRPYWGDANQMHVDGIDLRRWVLEGLNRA